MQIVNQKIKRQILYKQATGLNNSKRVAAILGLACLKRRGGHSQQDGAV